MDEVSSHVCLVLPSTDGKAARKIVPPRLRIPYWKGLGADSEEKHEPVSDIDTVVVDSLKALDPKRPIREADVSARDHLKDVAREQYSATFAPVCPVQDGAAVEVSSQPNQRKARCHWPGIPLPELHRGVQPHHPLTICLV